MAPLGVIPGNGSGEPLSLAVRRGVLALVIFFHVGGGWALTQLEPAKLIVGDIAPMEVRMVPAEQPAQPEPQQEEEQPPPEPPPPPPPVFPIEAKPPPPPPEPPKPTPPPEKPRPVQKKPQAPPAPVEAAPQQA